MRMKRAMALVAILIAIAVVSFLVHRRANRLRTDAPTGVADSGTPAAKAAWERRYSQTRRPSRDPRRRQLPRRTQTRRFPG